jgi:Tfp pilus assembly protein PilX
LLHKALKMPKKVNRKGIVLLLVITVILIVVILGEIILKIAASQARLTRHQAGRIQAYYAAFAGINYALDKLRAGTWYFSPTNTCLNTTPCILGPSTSTEYDFPKSIQNREVQIVFCEPDTKCGTAWCNPPSGIDFCVQAMANYTYTP